jgi:hypothetical protein
VVEDHNGDETLFAHALLDVAMRSYRTIIATTSVQIEPGRARHGWLQPGPGHWRIAGAAWRSYTRVNLSSVKC